MELLQSCTNPSIYRQNLNQKLNSQKTPHISSIWVSYGVSIIRNWLKINCVITALNCMCHPWNDPLISLPHSSSGSIKVCVVIGTIQVRAFFRVSDVFLFTVWKKLFMWAMIMKQKSVNNCLEGTIYVSHYNETDIFQWLSGRNYLCKP